MPTASHVSTVKLLKWFPPEDPLAAKIARLCILREDMLLEMQGFYAEEIRELDESSSRFRRVYLSRRLLLTLAELEGAIQTLLRDRHFRVLLRKQPRDIKAGFGKAGGLIARVHEILKDARNDICGHVRESAVQSALERLDPDAFGLLDLSPQAGSTHFKFTGELVGEILLKEVSNRERRELVSGKFASLADMLALFALIERCFLMYAEDRGLTPRGRAAAWPF
jgi:hypothetical protein